jgi:acyl dehydratase
MSILPAEAKAAALPHRYWEDVELGEKTRSAERVVDGQAMVEFASKYDPQYFHTDTEAAKDTLFGGLIGSGIYTAALWRMMDHEVNGEIAWVCGVAWDNVKWRRPVRAGDRICATSECVMKRPSGKRKDVGLVTLHHEVVRADGEVLLAFDSTNLVYRRHPAE